MLAVPSSPTRRQTGFNPTMDSTSTRTRNDTSSTIIPDSKDKIQTEQHFVQQPLPIPGTITTSQPHHQSSQSPSELPTPPDAEALLNFSIPTSINSQSSQNHVREDQKGVVLDSLVPVSTAAPTPTPTSNHSYPTSSTPGSLTSSSLGLSNSNSRNLNGNGNNGISLGSWNVSGSQRSSLGFGYSPYSTKSSGFKISSERGGSNVSPNPNSASPRTREPNTSIELEGTPERDSRMEGEGTGDSAGVFSFSSPYFGPQILNNQDEDLDGSEIDVDISGGDVKSPGWAAITLGQLSLSGNPNDSGGGLSTSPYLSTSTNRQGAVGGISSSRGGGGGSVPMVASNSGSGSSTNASRRYPPISSSNRPSNNRTNSGLSSSFQSGSPASRSLPSADDAIQAAAMHRRASYNRTASGAPRTSFGTSGPPSSFSFGVSGVGNGSPGSPSPMGIVASSSMTSNGSSRFGRKSGGGGRRRASRSRDRAKVNFRGKGRVTADGEFDDDATDDDEMALDVNDEDDDTEDELLVGKNGGRVGSESVVGDMDQDSEMEESESGSTYGESQKRMGGNGWSINSNGIGANRNLSGYYTSTRGEYVGNSKLSTSGGSSSLSRPSLLDRARNSASQSPSLGLTLNNGIPTNSSRSFNNGFDSPRGIGGGGMSSSFNNGIGIGTSPNSSGRHHPYAQSPRSVSGSFGASNGSPSNRSNLTSSNPISTNLKRGGFGESNNNSSLSASSSNSRIGVSPLSKGGSSSSGTIGTSLSPRNPSSNLPPLVTRGSSKRSSTQQEPPEEDNLSGSGDETESSEEISSSSIPKSKPSTSPSTSLSTSNSKKVVSNVNDDGTTAASAAAIRNRLGGASNCSAFISKLWHLMSNPEKYRDYIRWSEGGDSIILFSDNQKQDAFAKEVLPKLFKHGNVASFVRQLNLYGFQRVPTSRSLDDAEQSSAFQALSSNQSGLSSNWSSRKSKHQIASSAGAFYGPHSAFVHPNFMRGGEDRLPSMKPRSSKGKKNTEKDVDQEDEGPTKENGDRLDGNGMEIAGKIKKRGQVTKVAGHQQEESDDEDDLAFD